MTTGVPEIEIRILGSRESVISSLGSVSSLRSFCLSTLTHLFTFFFFSLPLTFVAEKQSLTKLVFKQKVIAIKSLQRGLGVGDHDFCLFVCLN